MDIRDDDAAQLDFSLSKYLIYPMASLNAWFADNRTPRFVSDTQDPEDITVFGEAIPKLVTAGAKIPVFYVNEKLKIPVPAEGEEILTMLTRTESITTDNEDIPNTQGGGTDAAAKLTALLIADRQQAIAVLDANSNNPSERSASKPIPSTPGQPDNAAQRTPYIDPTPVTSQTDQLAQEAGNSIKSMVEQVREITEKAQSLEELREALLNGYAHLDNTQLAKIMQYAFAATDLAGQFDVKHED